MNGSPSGFFGSSRGLRRILIWFQIVSDLKINLRKYEITPVGVVDNIEDMSHVLNCKVGTVPTTYLGLPLGA